MVLPTRTTMPPAGGRKLKGPESVSQPPHDAQSRTYSARPTRRIADTVEAPAASAVSRAATPDPEPAGGDVPVGGELLRRAYDALARHGAPLSSARLAEHIFGSQPQAASATWLPLVDQLLRPSPLFARDETGRWRIAAWDVAVQPLDDVEFVVVDVETTGLAPGRHRLIEIGAVIVSRGELGASFTTLVNPARKIPQFITQFTGISQRMVNRAPQASTVLPRLREFIGNRPIVGHNVGFDLNFLNYEAERCGISPAFPSHGVDTIALARHVLTGMRRVRLERLAAALHVPMPVRHRALPDAHATAKIFLLLLARVQQEGYATLEELLQRLDSASTSRASVPTHRPTGSIYLNPAWRQKFPTQPGVYLMKDASGEVIYVGKAKCLRDRLASYYSQPLGYTRKMDGLLQSVREIETRVLGSELEALLVESQLIKALQPRYNVQLRNYEHYPFIKVDVQHAYPRFYATREVTADGAHYFGPFRSGRIVDATVELIQKVFPIRTCTRALPPHAPASEPCLRYHLKRCPAPCRGLLDSEAAAGYAAAVEEACAFLGGERDDLIERLKRQMFEAAARQDFERAARLRDALRDADQVLLGQRLVTGAVEANNLLIVYPSAEPDHLEVFLVRHGRLAGQRRILQDDGLLATELRALVAEAAALGTPPARVGRAEVDQINIIARWIHHHSDDAERAFFRLPAHPDDPAEVEAFVATVLAALREAQPLTKGDASEEESAVSVLPDGAAGDGDNAW
jgi:DNA polymerase-3 subunit epsilon